MRRQFDQQLALLNRELIEMGALCEEVIALAAKALTEGDPALAAQTDDDTLSAKADYTLVNILESDLEPAVAELHRIFSHEAHEH